MATQTVQERKQGEKERRRHEILEVADGLFRNHGFHETTIEKIAHEAALGKGTVYYYYDNKEKILSDLLRQRTLQALRTLGESVSAAENVREVLGVASEVTLGFLIDHLSSVHILQREYDRFVAKCPAEMQGMTSLFRHCRRLLVKGLHNRMVSEGVNADASLVFDMTMSQVIGFAHQHAKLHHGRESVSARLSACIDIIDRGLPRIRPPTP